MGSKAGMDGARLAHIDSLVAEDIAASRYHGLVLKIAHSGEVVYEKAIGAADGAQTAAGAGLGVQHLLGHQGLHQPAGAAGDRAGALLR